MNPLEKGVHFGDRVDAYVEGRKGYPKEMFDFLAAKVPACSEKSALDLGCGTGEFSTKPLIELFHSVHACDVDERMLAKALKKLNGVPLVRSSAEELPYRDGQFGVITMFTSFHWFCNDQAVCQISRTLEDNGYVFLSAGGGGRPLKNKVQEILENVIGRKIIDPKEEYDPEGMLAKHNFKTIAKAEFKAVEYYTADEALKRCQSSSTWNDVVAENKEEEACGKLRDFFTKYIEDNGPIAQETKKRVLLMQKN
ncbi:MAG: class I SAM-dependent methyltransferase [Verrucomicrobia bacterium]|nr:class I SAM-dependent methyltransferase [Verrucomicrobiota bacterium]